MAVITESFPAYLARVKRIGQATCSWPCCWSREEIVRAADRAEDLALAERWLAQSEDTKRMRKAGT